MEKKFPCYFEREEKGIFMEVDDAQYENLIGFSFYNGFEIQGEVCLDEKQIKGLIEILQQKIKNKG